MNFSTEQIIKILQVKGIGRSKILKLVELINFKVSTDHELCEILLDNCKLLAVQSISKDQIYSAFEKAKALLELSDNLGIKSIPYYDSKYPPQLKNLAIFPIILYVKGDVNHLIDMPTIAVIGTREPSAYGSQIGERIGYRLGEEKINVVSGLAKGCDAAAHIGCLKASGITTAVLAHGLDTLYPKDNVGLAEKIIDSGGCLVSEYIVTTKILKNFFVERDRIQAGLSKATIVIETDIKGGTMHTVKFTHELERTLAVFNHPPNRHNDKSRGNQYLLQNNKVIPLQTKYDIDELINAVDPLKKRFFSNVKMPIAEMNLPLYNEEEWNSLIQPRKKEKKTRKPKKNKPESMQLQIEGQEALLDEVKKKARKKSKNSTQDEIDI